MGTATQLTRDLSSHNSASALAQSLANENPQRKTRQLRSLTRPRAPRPTRAELERACRIALMEADQPASVEVIYERILQRRSLVLLSYKRPFRAITAAMIGLVKRGEVTSQARECKAGLLRGGRQRIWSPAITHPPSARVSLAKR